MRPLGIYSLGCWTYTFPDERSDEGVDGYFDAVHSTHLYRWGVWNELQVPTRVGVAVVISTGLVGDDRYFGADDSVFSQEKVAVIRLVALDLCT